jgi:hypothetical protein
VAIFFSCLCGQNLREDDGRAGGQTRCPACGLAVRVPSPRHEERDNPRDAALHGVPETSQPVPPVPALELRAVEVATVPHGPPPLRSPGPAPDDDEVYSLSPVRHDRGAGERESRRLPPRAGSAAKDRRGLWGKWTLETRWSEFMAYPLRALPHVLVLAAGWATLILILGHTMRDGWGMTLPVLMIAYVLFGYTVAFLQATYEAASDGKAGLVAWPGLDMRATVRAGVQGVLAFLAGPVVPAVGAFLFWLYGGEPQGLDWLLLWALSLVTVGYWALALLAVQQTNRLRDLHPATVMKVARQFGFRAPLTAVLIALPVVIPALQTLGALDRPRYSPAGWVILMLCWTGQLSWMVFVLRLLGVRRFQASNNDVAVRPQVVGDERPARR